MVMKLLAEEQQQFGDIVAMPHLDSYDSIGFKTLGMCQYASKINVKYLMKCDDDTFVRIPELEKRLSGFDGKLFYMGSISYNSEPHRNTNSKWYISYEQYSNSVYPPFAHGPGYVLPKALCVHIAKEDDIKELKVLPLEDVGMAVWVEHAVKVHGMAIEYVNEHRFNAGLCANDMISGHYVEPDRHIRLFNKDITNQHPLCY